MNAIQSRAVRIRLFLSSLLLAALTVIAIDHTVDDMRTEATPEVFYVVLILIIVAMVLCTFVFVQDVYLPMKRMTQQLLSASRDPDNIGDYITPVNRKDEVGVAHAALNELFFRISHNLQRLHKSNIQAGRRLEAIEASRDGICMVDSSGRLTYANKAYWGMHAQVAGTEDSHVLWLDLYEKDARETLKHSSLVILQQDGFWNGEIEYVNKDGGKVILEISLTMLEDGGFIGNERDVTTRKKEAIEKEDLQRLFAQAQKMEAVGRLTGGIAHDFNNMLAVISGNLEMLQDEIQPDSGMDKYVLGAQRATYRGAELTQRLLSFSRRQILSPKVISVGPIVHDALTLLTRAVNEKIDLVVDVSESVWKVSIDVGQLENALLNLAINARDAMPKGGQVKISAENVNVGKKEAVSFEAAAGPYVRLSVQDTGAGIPENIISRVCEPFFSTKEVGQGTGLGLSMVYGFVRQSGGFVKIESTVGVGTCISMYFPRHEVVVQSDVIATQNEKVVYAGRRGTVVIAEDDPDVLDITEQRLKRMGYKIHVARSGPEAVNIFKNVTSVDLLLADVVMPGGMDGPELAAKAQAVFPKLKVLFLSGHAADDDVLKPFAPGSARYLQKPYTQVKLAEEIDNLMQARA